MREIEKMQAGMWYDANFDVEILESRARAQELYYLFNQTMPLKEAQKERLLAELLGYYPEGLSIMQPFYCDYGRNIHLGEHVFINLGCYFMDGAPITLGDHCFVGPYTGFYTAAHPNGPKARNQGLEQARPITVGDNCWFGANVSVMPGVTIGDNVVVAAGSVVTHDLPDNVIAGGVPCQVIRPLNESDEELLNP